MSEVVVVVVVVFGCVHIPRYRIHIHIESVSGCCFGCGQSAVVAGHTHMLLYHIHSR